MFEFLFRTSPQAPVEGIDIDAASETLRSRMGAMLEHDARRKTRFAIVETPERKAQR